MKYTLDYRRLKDGTKVRSLNRFSLGWTGVVIGQAFNYQLGRKATDKYVVQFKRNALGHPLRGGSKTFEIHGKYLEVM